MMRAFWNRGGIASFQCLQATQGYEVVPVSRRRTDKLSWKLSPSNSGPVSTEYHGKHSPGGLAGVAPAKFKSIS